MLRKVWHCEHLLEYQNRMLNFIFLDNNESCKDSQLLILIFENACNRACAGLK